MRFSHYMQKWLYEDDGYYAKMPEIGKNGDFYTSVSTSKFFGGAIANRLLKTIENGFLSQNAMIVEIGAHKGYLISDMIEFIYTLEPRLLKTLSFVVIEPLENVRKAQKAYFKQRFGDEVRIIQKTNINECEKSEAFIVANELFDAFCCEIVDDEKMAFVENDKIVFRQIDKDLAKKASNLSIQKGEIPIGYEEFIRSLSTKLSKFEAIFFDYGEKKPRNDFSLRVYKNHQVFSFFDFYTDAFDIRNFYKNSDITYDVSFEILINEFAKNNAKVELFETQAKALVDFGILNLLEILRKNVNEKIYQNELNKVKNLIFPQVFGERFKALIIRKDYENNT